MTGGLAHEIKNPLSTIGLNAQMLAEGIQDSELAADEKHRLVNRVGTLRRETDRLAGILRDFLEYAGQIRLELREADLNAMLLELVDFYSPEAERTGVRIRTDLFPGDVKARVDVQRLKQCVLNLMLNAVQAMAPAAGAPASSAGSSGPRGELILRTLARKEPTGEVVQIHVIDTGPGMSAEVVARVFNPYFTTKAGGSGLGLPTARRLIEAHGGRIDLYSEPGKGTDFTIVLPVQGPSGQIPSDGNAGDAEQSA